MNKLIFLIISFLGIFFISCSDNEPKDNVKEITMIVSSETGIMYAWPDDKMEHPIECMLVKTEDNTEEWQQLPFNGIQGFSYERGHEYELRVKRTIIANPLADGSDRYYELIRIVSDKLVTDPEFPIDDNIRSEADIEYYEDGPINKYSISSGYNVNEDGAITYADGSALPSYNTTRIWIENDLDKADPNWAKYNKASYQATYSYVISPLSDKIRLVRNDSHGPMFKDVIPEDEFNHITRTMTAGEELKYALILANVYKKGIQKLEITIRKIGKIEQNEILQKQIKDSSDAQRIYCHHRLSHIGK